ncbi:MAG TPA: DUF1579 domain-containing protein [Longimicrobium sp.]|nr:DUF1579 domain-containing protein [Longimicrobium sp.]
MKAETRKEHQWLHRLVGEWTVEAEAPAEEGQPAEKISGRESVRSLGDAWVILEGEGEIPGTGITRSIMTLGFDERKGKFVGTFVGSMMTYLWIYEGGLDGDVLTLETTGPSFTDEGKMAQYRDIVELRGDDHRVLSSVCLGEDGQWSKVMEMHYHRVR